VEISGVIVTIDKGANPDFRDCRLRRCRRFVRGGPAL